MIFVGFVDDAGHFALDNREAFRVYIQRFKGHEVIVTVRKKVRDVSKARRYYRGVVVPDIAAASGYSDPDDYEQVHQGLAWKFLRLPDGPMGNPRRQSTSDQGMTGGDGKLTMSDYIDKCILWAETSIPGCRVRRPDEVNEDDYEEWDGAD